VIRGVSTGITGAGADANVAIYIDDVYQPSQQSNNFEFNNVENVQVLKGPQGTLFGRNATGGAILVKTLDPSFTPYADAIASYGTFNEVKGSLYVTGPITDQIAVNLAAYYDHDDGYVYNEFTKSRTSQTFARAVRAKLLYKPNDKFSVLLEANYSRSGDNAPFANGNLNGQNAYNYELAQQGLTLPTKWDDVSLIQNPVLINETFGGSAHIKADVGFGTFTDIISLQEIHPYIAVDVSNSPLAEGYAQIWNPERTFTEQLDYASPQIGIFSAIAGVYYYNDNNGSRLVVTDGDPGAPTEVELVGGVKTNAEAVFAEGTFDFTSRIRLIVGGRYSSEGKSAYAGVAGVSCVFAGYCNESDRWHAFTPRAVAQYSFDDYSNVYFSFSEGFKSGNYDVQSLDPVPVKPESIDAYEVGYKIHRGNTNFHAAAYYYDYTNIQVEQAVLVDEVLQTVWENAASAKIYGVDADIDQRINDNLSISAGFEFTHARYGEFPGDLIYSPTYSTMGNEGGAPCTAGAPGCYFAGNVQTLINGAGKEIERTPEYSGFVTVNYTHDLPYGKFAGNLTASYKSSYYFDPGDLVANPAYWMLNAKISWISPNNRYIISIWGKNITNSHYYLWGGPNGDGDQILFARPATMGISAEAKF